MVGYLLLVEEEQHVQQLQKQQQQNQQQKQQQNQQNVHDHVQVCRHSVHLHKVWISLNRDIPEDVLISSPCASDGKQNTVRVIKRRIRISRYNDDDNDNDEDDDDDINININVRIHKTVKVRRSKKRRQSKIRHHPYAPVVTHHSPHSYEYTPLFTQHLHK